MLCKEIFNKFITNNLSDPLLENHGDFISSIKGEELIKYIEKALENDCFLGIGDFESGLFIKVKDKNGDDVIFIQSIYMDPRNNTFMIIEKDGKKITANRCLQCEGINLWETDKLLKSSYVCGKCKRKIDNQDELNFVLYAGLECEECAKDSWQYIDSKPNGYWTK